MKETLEREEPWQMAAADRAHWAAMGKGFVQRILRRRISSEFASGRFSGVLDNMS